MNTKFLTHLVIVLVIHLLLLIGGGLEAPKFLKRDSSNVVVMSIIESRERARTQETPVKKVPKKKKVPSESQEKAPEEKPEQEAVASPAPGRAGVDNLLVRYKESLRSRIDEEKYYPPMSRRMGQRGTAIVGFTLLKDGHIINTRVLKSSGFSRLDDAAKEAVTKVGEFDPIPDELGMNSMDLEIPVKFTENI